jgi:hypothetical protein
MWWQAYAPRVRSQLAGQGRRLPLNLHGNGQVAVLVGQSSVRLNQMQTSPVAGCRLPARNQIHATKRFASSGSC